MKKPQQYPFKFNKSLLSLHPSHSFSHLGFLTLSLSQPFIIYHIHSLTSHPSLSLSHTPVSPTSLLSHPHLSPLSPSPLTGTSSSLSLLRFHRPSSSFSIFAMRNKVFLRFSFRFCSSIFVFVFNFHSPDLQSVFSFFFLIFVL